MKKLTVLRLDHSNGYKKYLEYPIYIEGRESGTLSETTEGLYTVFRADCPKRNGMIRLWLHGGGQSACLGLLAPRGDLPRKVEIFGKIVHRGSVSAIDD